MVETMGTPTDPTEESSGCSLCFGSGQAFGDRGTPKYMRVNISGMKPGEDYDLYGSPPLSGSWLLEHISGCYWLVSAEDYTIALTMDQTVNALSYSYRVGGPPFEIFLSETGSVCRKIYKNSDPNPDIAFGGTATVEPEGSR